MSKDGRPILLSLDGGGAKGWSQLPLISGLISLIKKGTRTHDEKSGFDGPVADEMLSEEHIYPCEYFVSSHSELQHYIDIPNQGPYCRQWNWRDQRDPDGSPRDVNCPVQRSLERLGACVQSRKFGWRASIQRGQIRGMGEGFG